MNKNEINKLTGNRLDSAIKSKYGDKRGCYSSFLIDLEKIGYPINPRTLSELSRGLKKLDGEKARIFSKILNVSTEYLLGLVTFDNPKEESEFKSLVINWKSEDYQNINMFRRIMEYLASNHRIVFDAYEIIGKKRLSKKVIYESDGITLFNINNAKDYHPQSISQEGFYNWVCTLPIPVVLMENTSSNNAPMRYIHLADKVVIAKKEPQTENNKNSEAALTLNEFIKMIYDIDDSMTAALNNRIDYWMTYSEFDYKQKFMKESEDYELE